MVSTNRVVTAKRRSIEVSGLDSSETVALNQIDIRMDKWVILRSEMMCNEPTIHRRLALKMLEMRRTAVMYYEQRFGSDGAKCHWFNQMTY